MKALIIATSLLLVGCTATEIEQPAYNDNNYYQNCGKVIGMGDTPTVDYIDVRMDYQTGSQKNRYKVSNINDYDLNQKICNFDGMQQIAW